MAYMPTWSSVTGLPVGEYYYSTEIAGDGVWYACAFNQDLFRSTDQGVTWSQSAGLTSCEVMCASADGSIVYVFSFNYSLNTGAIYKSTDHGLTFSQLADTVGKSWLSICCSGDGSRVYGLHRTAFSVSLLTVSADGGATWTAGIQFNITAVSISCSTDGTKVLFGNNQNANTPDFLYVSTDSGASFTQTGVTGRYLAVCMSRDGSTLYAGKYNGFLYKSVDDGATWDPVIETNTYWVALGCSADGSKAVALTNNDIFTSEDSGVTWNNVFTSYELNFDCNIIRAISADGTMMLIGTWGSGASPVRSPALPTGVTVDIENAFEYVEGQVSLFLDGFDYYETEHLALKWGFANNINVLPTSGRSSGGCIAPGNNAVLSSIDLGGATHTVIGFALKVVARAEFSLTFNGTGTTMNFLTDGRVQFTGSSTLSPTGVLPLGSWVYLEIGLAPDSLQMRVNGSAVGWVPSAAWINNSCSSVTISYSGSSANLSGYWMIDDLRITFGEALKWFGNSRVVALELDGNSTPQDWAASGDPAWQQLTTFTGDISATQPGSSSVFTVSGLLNPPNSLHGVQLNVYGQDASSTPLSLATVLRSGTENVGETFTFSDQLSLRREAHLVNPSTNLEFSSADLDAIEIGVTTV